VAVKRVYEWDCVGVSCCGDRLLRALTMASQAERLLCVVEAGPSKCEGSVSCRKRKVPAFAFLCCSKDAKVGASAVRPGGASARSRAGDA
jgi:hypothetical protein